jgi:hypothetical protein
MAAFGMQPKEAFQKNKQISLLSELLPPNLVFLLKSLFCHVESAS